KPIKKGESSCYGLTWTAPADGYLAVVPVGYADGLPRSIQGSLEVTISGKSYPHVGRVSMDQIVVDLGENPFGVSPDDEVIIFGEGGKVLHSLPMSQALSTMKSSAVPQDARSVPMREALTCELCRIRKHRMRNRRRNPSLG